MGHLALANYLCEFEELDEIWFLVTPQNPFKTHNELWDDNIRLELVQKATEEYPRFKASDFEFRLPKPTYSVHTLEQLRTTFPNREFYFIIGADNWFNIARWYQAERIIRENQIWVYPRPGYTIDENNLPPNVRFVHSPTFDISSTFIRNALLQGKDVRYFVHPKVWSYINEHAAELHIKTSK